MTFYSDIYETIVTFMKLCFSKLRSNSGPRIRYLRNEIEKPILQRSAFSLRNPDCPCHHLMMGDTKSSINPAGADPGNPP